MADTSKRSAAKKSTSRSRNTKGSDNPELQALRRGPHRDHHRRDVRHEGRAVRRGRRPRDLRGRHRPRQRRGPREEQRRDARRSRSRSPWSSPGSQFRWPGGVVPYEIDPAMPDQQRVHDAIAHWEQQHRDPVRAAHAANAGEPPELGALPSTAAAAPRRSACRATASRTSRWAPGATRAGASTRSATPSGCGTSRAARTATCSSRSSWANIQAGKEHNFNQHITDGDDVGAYDYGSIMHYERTAFTKNGQETVTPINPANAQIGQRVGAEPGRPRRRREHVRRPPATFKKVADDGGTVNVKKFSDDGPLVLKKPQRRPAAVQEAPDDPPIRSRRCATTPAGEETARRPARWVQEDQRRRPGRRGEEDPRRRRRHPAPVPADRTRTAPSGRRTVALPARDRATTRRSRVAPTERGRLRGSSGGRARPRRRPPSRRPGATSSRCRPSLTWAISQLAKAQESYDALAASLQG